MKTKRSHQNNIFLKKLISEVIRELNEEDEAETLPDAPDKDAMKHSLKHEKEYGNVVTFHIKNVSRGNTHILKDFLAQAAHAAKMADLEVINAEIEKDGKPIITMDSSDLKSMEPEVSAEEDPENNFNIHNTKSVTRKTSKERPPLQPNPEEYKAMKKRDLAADRQLAKDKAAGKVDPNDETRYWDEEDWNKWEKENPPAPGKKGMLQGINYNK